MKTALSADQNAVTHCTEKLRYIKYARTCKKNKTIGTYKGANEDETAKKR